MCARPFVPALLFLSLLLPAATWARGPSPSALFREDFQDLSRWRSVALSHRVRTRYRIVPGSSDLVLEAHSDASASGLRWTGSYDVRAHPTLRWRWKVGGVYRRGDATRKSGDDYPLRVYVVFAYDPDSASVGDSIAHAAASLFTDEPPPQSALSYIWANRPHHRRILESLYSDRARTVVLEAGGARAGEWVEEEVDVLADYRAAFGEEPPRKATLGIMSDADDTGEASTSWLDRIEIRSGGAR